MRRQPRLDIAAAFRRQFVVDEGMQLVFGGGNRWIGHCRFLFLVESSGVLPFAPCRRKEERPATRYRFPKIHTHNVGHHFTRRNAGRSPSSEAFTCARARARRDITVPIGTPWMSATSR